MTYSYYLATSTSYLLVGVNPLQKMASDDGDGSGNNLEWWHYVLMVLGALVLVPFFFMCFYGYCRSYCCGCCGASGASGASGADNMGGRGGGGAGGAAADNQLYASTSSGAGGGDRQPSSSGHRKKKKTRRGK